MIIGAIGTRRFNDVILFGVSPERILTFRDMIQRSSVRFARNEILLRKPISQYIGPSLDTISLKIALDIQYGVNPREEYEKLSRIQREGSIVSIIIGKKVYGSFRWRIVDLSIPEEHNRGFVRRSEITVSFEEYARG